MQDGVGLALLHFLQQGGRDFSTEHFDARARNLAFHGRFYGLRIFGCKSVQFSATRREYETAESPSVGNAAQHPEKLRKKPSLNYESPAPPLPTVSMLDKYLAN